jgi:tetratricopeptide (TPR) repeat protein
MLLKKNNQINIILFLIFNIILSKQAFCTETGLENLNNPMQIIKQLNNDPNFKTSEISQASSLLNIIKVKNDSNNNSEKDKDITIQPQIENTEDEKDDNAIRANDKLVDYLKMNQGIFTKKTNKVNVNHPPSSRISNNDIYIEVKATSNTKKGLLEKYEKQAYDALIAGKFEVAILLYQKALSINKNKKSVIFGLATCYQLLHENDQAVFYYHKLIKMKDFNQKIINNLLIALANKNPSDALIILSSIEKDIPNNHLILSHIGNIYIKMQQYENAIGYLLNAIELTNDNALYAYNLAIAYDASKQYEYAKHYYEFALKNQLAIKTNNIDIKDVKKRIEEIELKQQNIKKS